MFKPQPRSLAGRTGQLAGQYVRARQEMALALKEIFGDLVHDGRPLPPEAVRDPRESANVELPGPAQPRQSPGVKQEPTIDLEGLRGSGPFTVFVLGAGASKDAGFPICRDFFSTAYLEQVGIRLDPNPGGGSLSGAGIEELLMEAYSSDMAQFERLKVFYERVFFRADSKFKNVTGSTPTRQWVDETLHYFFLLAYFLEAAAQGRHVVVISFNHDLCVEELLRNQSFNYGTLTKRMYSVGDYPGLPNFGHDLTLLKMHGSFNFAHCKNCDAIWCECDWVWDKGNDYPCGKCGQLGYNFYVPPSVTKDVSNLKEAWEDARHFLRHAEEVFVVGYSLPSYDTHAVELFEHTSPEAELAIIDPFAPDLLQRYASIMPVRNRFFSESTWHEFTQDLMFEYWPFVRF